MNPNPRVNSPISTAELERRWSAARAAMADEGIDVREWCVNPDTGALNPADLVKLMADEIGRAHV